MDIHTLWAFVIGFSIVMYIIFDGFDLGVGILMPLIKNEKERDTMVNSITPVWDGNETWLILAGVGLFGGFPTAYSILLPALYLPLIVMLLSLILRGVAMEFRFQSVAYKSKWDIAFTTGSVGAAFCQGVILGNLLEGIQTNPGTDTSFYFFTPFTMLIGLTNIIAYASIGSGWLYMKTSGSLQQTFKKCMKIVIGFLLILLLFIIIGRFNISWFGPRLKSFGFHDLYSPLTVGWAVSAAILIAGIFWGLHRKEDWIPFALNIILNILSSAYLISGFWPYIIPPSVSIYNAGAPTYGNTILLYVAFIVIPMILSYLAYSYLVFKGKVSDEPNYEPDFRDIEVLKNLPRKQENEFKTKLSGALRIVISILGIGYFFTVIGLWGDRIAQLSIALFAFIFAYFWYRQSRSN